MVEIMSLVNGDGHYNLVRLKRYDHEVAHIRTLQDGRLAFALYRGRSIPSVIDWRTSSIVNLEPFPDLSVSVNTLANSTVIKFRERVSQWPSITL